MFRPVMLIVLLLTILAHVPALRAGFVYEDQHWIPSVLGNDNDRWSGDNRFSASNVLFDMDRALYGANPTGYHLTNLLVHLGNGALVYHLAIAVADPTVAVIASSLFLLHPLQTEAVDYVVERTELAAVSCVLGVLLLSFRRLTPWTALAMVVLAFVSIETKVAVGVTVFLLLPLVTWSRLDRRVGVVLACVAALVAPTMLVKLSDRSVASSGYLHAFLIDTVAWCRYVSLAIIPVGLSVDHDFSVASRTMVAMAGCLFAAYVGIATWWRRQPIGLALLWVVLAVLPRMLIATNESLNEHHFYGPMVGVSLVIGLLLSHFFQEVARGTALPEYAVSQDSR